MILHGKTAVITGGGRGIGAVIARAFAREGAKVLLASRTRAELEATAAQIEQAGGAVRYAQADVSDRLDATRIVETALAAYGRVDILVNGAGVYGPIGPLAEVDVEEWLRAFATNVFGTFLCCHAVLPHMMSRRCGKIINFSGGGATSPLPRFTAYGVSKTAVVRLTETLAEEVKPSNIQVNVIAPGMVDTRLQDHVLAAGSRAGELAGRIRALRQTGEGGVPPERAAALALFLASAAADGLTGKLISAPHDGWESWDAARIEELMAAPWLTLRRIDPFTLKPLMTDKNQ